MKIKSALFISGMLLFGSTHAGFYSATAHSRANCANNESITWYYLNPWLWHVISFHYDDYRRGGSPYHKIDTGLSHTWRQAAVCWGEGNPRKYNYVVGFHYYVPAGTNYERLDVNTYAENCNIYDGWWDK